jgi:hypothetical protein
MVVITAAIVWGSVAVKGFWALWNNDIITAMAVLQRGQLCIVITTQYKITSEMAAMPVWLVVNTR